jgi:hypothetical protein
MSEQKPRHEVEGIVYRAPRQDCVEAQIRERAQKQICSIEGPQGHRGLVWTTFGTSKTLPRAGIPAKLRNRGRRALVREVTKNPMVTLTELQSSSVEMGEPLRRKPSLQNSTNHAFMVEWPDGSHSSLKFT